MTCEQVHQNWKAEDLKPHRIRMFKISKNPHFAEKVSDVVGLYINSPNNTLMLPIDEKTPIQPLDQPQSKLQLRPGQVERHTAITSVIAQPTYTQRGSCDRKNHSASPCRRFFEPLATD